MTYVPNAHCEHYTSTRRRYVSVGRAITGLRGQNIGLKFDVGIGVIDAIDDSIAEVYCSGP